MEASANLTFATVVAQRLEQHVYLCSRSTKLPEWHQRFIRRREWRLERSRRREVATLALDAAVEYGPFWGRGRPQITAARPARARAARPRARNTCERAWCAHQMPEAEVRSTCSALSHADMQPGRPRLNGVRLLLLRIDTHLSEMKDAA